LNAINKIKYYKAKTMEIDIQPDKNSLRVPETIDRDLFFEIKVFYGLIIVAYIALGVLVIVK
jgi:hypothetical protein